jgi:uncharacterized protein (TIGR00730 family)
MWVGASLLASSGDHGFDVMVGCPRVVCVLCGTRVGDSPAFVAAARELGERLAAAGLVVLYGGARVGVMGALADAALGAGGRVEGVMPSALLDFGIEEARVDELRVVRDLAEQQAVMLQRADAFVALPGGLGTFYELAMVMTAAQLAIHGKPIVLANVEGFYDPVLVAIEHAVERGFASWQELRLVHSFETVSDLVAALLDWRDGCPGSPLVCSVAANSGRDRELQSLARGLAREGGQGGRGNGSRSRAPEAEWPPHAWTTSESRGSGSAFGRGPRSRAPVSGGSLHLVYGPTGCGKTDRATALARETGSPVVVLDRIQCHSALAVGSGRPRADEFAGTRRVYLCERPVSAGELPAGEAHRLLVGHVEQLVASDGSAILEGGSVSLLARVYREPWWESFSWSSERCRLPPAEEYRHCAVLRVREMVTPTSGSPGILEELASAWGEPRARPTLLSVFTYRVALHVLLDCGVAVKQAPMLGKVGRERLIEALADAMCAHARWQDRQLGPPPPGWLARDRQLGLLRSGWLAREASPAAPTALIEAPA